MTVVLPKVLIVSGGPSGLVLAISLLQNGVPVRIIEKNASPRLGQRGAGIMASAFPSQSSRSFLTFSPSSSPVH
ncbi:hypothetical protein P691DRAFT_800166 [Macrolepiota fuliginosa MF-IS2]|uniref:FAD-binding domain-containing protein n=1 Tax=Macrolepiota fuliginosa MF-IS2 TaxID=1400762 RepID=A0A9P5XMG9_9AGAR|nr:hypothetical protein P691DRAFT_800166 [Macrolepiota fuliginosa MF-IS2]